MFIRPPVSSPPWLEWLAIPALGVAALMALNAPAQAQPRPSSFAAIGGATSVPFGWMDFCRRQPGDCRDRNAVALDADLSNPRAWATLERINRQVNRGVESVTDMEQFGVEDYWTYPDTGRGDCEDYVLLKRRMLRDAGFPIQSLLITVVRDENDEGHAILTVKTTHGEYVLDNKREAILPWQNTGYRFVKRQSQTDANVWVQIGPPSEAMVASIAPRGARAKLR